MKTPHKISLIDQGLASFAKRIELIEAAKETIELEFFIYELDQSSRFLSSKLIEASKRGVKVKILVDFSIAVFKLAPEYVSELAKSGIEVRYYNTAKSSELISMQHRNHRKFLIIDGVAAFTGGRNIADEYFDLSKTYNFLDSDILVEGEIVKKIQKSFYFYWESKFSTKPDLNPGGESKNFFKLKDLGRTFSKKLKNIDLNSIFTTECSDISFVTDFPGVSPTNRQVYRRIESIVKNAKNSLLVESPYLVLKQDGFELLENLEKRNVEVSILSNSLASTDAFYTVSALWLKASDIRKAQIDVNLFDGSIPTYPEAQATRYGIHSKRAVIDNKDSLIGTYNIDPRSANLNSEVLLICRNNPDLANAITKSINNRKKDSVDLGSHDSNLDAILYKADFPSKLKFYLATPIVYFFDFLL